jgi:hypothetical protein
MPARNDDASWLGTHCDLTTSLAFAAGCDSTPFVDGAHSKKNSRAFKVLSVRHLALPSGVAYLRNFKGLLKG